MQITCIECKNSIDTSTIGEVKKDQIIECPMCGITLLVTALQDDGTVGLEIVDEGK